MPFPFLFDTENTSLAAQSVGKVEPGQCRFTIDTPDGSDWTFCPKKKTRGSYCASHARDAYTGTFRVEKPVLAVVGTRNGRSH